MLNFSAGLQRRKTMNPRRFGNYVWRLLVLFVVLGLQGQRAGAKEKHLLYVASPGIRNYVEYGGVGVLVFDADNGYKFVKRIPTWAVPAGKTPDNVKGIAASARTGKLYVSNLNRIVALDLLTDKIVWDKAYEGGCDRLAISPDGKILYVPSFEGPHWNVINAMTGDIITKIEPKSGAHNTIYSADGAHAYLAGLHSPILTVADTKTHTIAKTVGPFSNVIRPFTINGSQTLCYVNLNGLLGFEVGDLKTGKKLYRVEVEGYKQGPVKRHGCPSHGIAMTPDEKEIWLCDGANSRLHIFDATVTPPKLMSSIQTRDQPGWITFSIDGRYVYPSTGEVIDAHTKQIIAALKDETGREVHSEKVLEIIFDNDKPIRAGDQFGKGTKR
jgi:DNA-binding beta-propeller fold protein YncE